MSYGDLQDCFQKSFPQGRFKEFMYLGGNICQYTNLKMDDKNPEFIEKATVCYNQEHRTVIINETTDEVTYI